MLPFAYIGVLCGAVALFALSLHLLALPFIGIAVYFYLRAHAQQAIKPIRHLH